jgi:hypothetical protein
MVARTRQDVERIKRNVEQVRKVSDRVIGLGPFGVGVDGLISLLNTNPITAALGISLNEIYTWGAGGWLIYQAAHARASGGVMARMLGYVAIDSVVSGPPRRSRCRAGRSPRRRPDQRVEVLRRDHAADHDHDVLAALLGEFGLELRHQREMACRQRRHADDVDVVLDGLSAASSGVCEQRPDIDVEAEIGEGRGDHLLAAVVAVLAHLGDRMRGRRPSASSKARSI